jgi:hypothetical protein
MVWLLAIALGLTGLTAIASPASAVGRGHITGTVTGPNDRPAPGVTITGYIWQEDSEGWEKFASTFTIGDGSYDLGGLPTDTYRVGFSGHNFNDEGSDFQTEYWNDAASVETAEDIEVWSGAVYPDRDAELSEAGGPRIANTSLPVISGTAQAGSTLTASTGTWDPSTGLSIDYEWRVGGTVVATGPSYTPTNYVGSPVQVAVTASKDGYRSRTATSEPTADLANGPAPVFQTQPAITGIPRVGAKVAATPGTWTPTSGPSHVDWLVDDVVMVSGPSYTPVAADAGKSLRVRTTAWAPWAVADIATSPSTTITPGTLKAVTKPRVIGRAVKNATLAVTKGLWSPGTTRRAIQWYADGRAIPKATSTRLELRGRTLRAVLGKKITVKLTVGARGYTSVTTTLRAPGKVKR